LTSPIVILPLQNGLLHFPCVQVHPEGFGDDQGFGLAFFLCRFSDTPVVRTGAGPEHGDVLFVLRCGDGDRIYLRLSAVSKYPPGIFIS